LPEIDHDADNVVKKGAASNSLLDAMKIVEATEALAEAAAAPQIEVVTAPTKLVAA
jgi:hypothetical protein